MATVDTAFNRLPLVYRQKYGSTQRIDWTNELLERLSGESFVFPTLDIEAGATVADDIWIDKPSGCREIRSIYYPENPDAKYRWKEVNNRIKLIDAEVDAQSSPDAITAFSNYATTYIDVDITDKEENDFENYLLVITGGTYENRTYVIGSNDASGVSTTRLYFLHPLTAALDGTKVTAGQLIDPDYYVMIEYSSTYDSVSAVSDEIPIDDKYERRLTNTWFRFKVEEHISALSPETGYWGNAFEDALKQIKGERFVMGGPIRPRYIPGLEQYREGDSYWRKDFESEQ